MFRHSKWLDFMAKRLCIASSLLKDSGILLISCDDHEQAHLKLLCDDIFGNENFIGTFVWEKTAHTGKQTKNMYNTVEYIICYAKQLYNTAGQAVSKKTLLVADTQTIFEDAPLYNASNNERTLTFAPKSVAFKIPDGLYDHSSDPKYKLVTSVVIKNGVNETPLQMSFRSRWQQSTCDKHIQIGGSFIVKSTSFAIRTVYSNKRTAFSVAPKQLIATSPSVASTTRFGERVGTTEQGSAILHKILGNKIFDYPKPVSLIKYLVSLHLSQNAVVMDFFAGSGGTAQAIAELNSEDGGSRRWILVTNNEGGSPDDPSTGIMRSVTKPRIDTVLTGIRPDGTKYSDGTGDGYDFFTYDLSLAQRLPSYRQALSMYGKPPVFDGYVRIRYGVGKTAFSVDGDKARGTYASKSDALSVAVLYGNLTEEYVTATANELPDDTHRILVVPDEFVDMANDATTKADDIEVVTYSNILPKSFLK